MKKKKKNKTMEKEYPYIVKIEFGGQVNATSKKQAKDIIKDDFYEDYGLELRDEEIEIEN